MSCSQILSAFDLTVNASLGAWAFAMQCKVLRMSVSFSNIYFIAFSAMLEVQAKMLFEFLLDFLSLLLGMLIYTCTVFSIGICFSIVSHIA